MGLVERRAVKEFQDNKLAGLQQQIDAAAGFAVPLEVDWDTLAAPGDSHLYDECWPPVYFEPIVHAFAAVTRDDLGRDALKNGLKKIIIANRRQSASIGSWASLNAGVLTLDHLPTTNIADVTARAEALQEVLERDLE